MLNTVLLRLPPVGAEGGGLCAQALSTIVVSPRDSICVHLASERWKTSRDQLRAKKAFAEAQLQASEAEDPELEWDLRRIEGRIDVLKEMLREARE